MDDAADDLRAAVAARRELGPDFEPEIVESFLERLDQTIEARVDARLAEAAEPAREGTPAEVVFASMLGGLLATGVIGLTLDSHETTIVFLVWIIVAVVNLAPAVGRRR